MNGKVPKTMMACVIDKFGGPGVLRPARMPVPEPGPGEILIKVQAAGIGSWDPWVREGGMGGAGFPQVLGSDGAGKVVAVGPKVRRFEVGDRVYGYVFGNPKGGFYAQYAAVPEKAAAPIPGRLNLDQAGGLGGCGLTAIAGFEGLKIGPEWTVLVLGASGGVGHIALQLAKRLGARVLAVASGRDGVALAESLGADMALNGKAADVARAARSFAPGGFDAALVFANSDRLAGALKQVRPEGTIAYPEGVEPAPRGVRGTRVRSFNGVASREAFERLNALIAGGPFRVAIGGTYRLGDLARAHRDVQKHHLGKLILKP